MVYIIYYLLLMSIINDVTKIYCYCYEIITKKERKEERTNACQSRKYKED